MLIEAYIFFQEYTILSCIILFLFGSCFGSFLNVVIHRLPIMLNQQWTELSQEFLKQPIKKSAERYDLFFPPSTCTHCLKSIAPYHNIPIVSFFWLGGKCARCSHPFSSRYWLIELLTGLLTVLIFTQFGLSYKFLFALIFCYFLIAMTFIDLDTQLLPDNLTLSLLWLGLIINSYNLFTPLKLAVLSACSAYLFLYVFIKLFYWITKKEGMGEGDLKLFAAFGAWLGPYQLPLILILSSLVGSIIGWWHLKAQGKDSDTPIPFGPFLCVAGFISLIWGNELILWYMSFYP